MTKTKVDKKIETVVISEEDYLEDNYKPPSGLYIRNALGEAVFYRSRDRLKVQQQVDETFGKGMYLVRTVVKAQAR